MAGPIKSDILTVVLGGLDGAESHVAAYSAAWNSSGGRLIRYRFLYPRLLGWMEQDAHLLRFAVPGYLRANGYTGWAIYLETPAVVLRDPREIINENGHSNGWHVREDGKDHVALIDLEFSYGLPKCSELTGFSPVDLERMRERSGKLFRTINNGWGTENEYRHGETRSIYYTRPVQGKDGPIFYSWLERAKADRVQD